MSPEVSIVIPVYNSGQILPNLVENIRQHIQDKYTFEIILTDDCSGDNSWDKITALAQTHSFVKGIRLSKNRGQFETVIIGVFHSNGHFIVNMDDDMEHPSEEIFRLIEYLKHHQEKDIVFGTDKTKYLKKGSSQTLHTLRNIFINFVWGKYPTDSFRAFRRNVIFDEAGAFLVRHPMLEAHLKHNLPYEKVAYFPTDFQPRMEGVSGVNFYKKLKLFLLFTPYYFTWKEVFKILTLIFAVSFLLSLLSNLVAFVFGISFALSVLVLLLYSKFKKEKVSVEFVADKINFE